MSKYGGSEKTTQAFLLQHITSRGTRLAPLEQRGARRLRYLLMEDEPSPRLLPRPSGHFQPWSDVGWGYWEDSMMSLLDVALPHWPLAGLYLSSSITCYPNKSSSLCPLTPCPAQEQHTVL